MPERRRVLLDLSRQLCPPRSRSQEGLGGQRHRRVVRRSPESHQDELEQHAVRWRQADHPPRNVESGRRAPLGPAVLADSAPLQLLHVDPLPYARGGAASMATARNPLRSTLTELAGGSPPTHPAFLRFRAPPRTGRSSVGSGQEARTTRNLAQAQCLFCFGTDAGLLHELGTMPKSCQISRVIGGAVKLLAWNDS